MAGWPLWLALAAGGAQAQGSPGERACADAVQGKVAWSQRGDRSWQPANLARLCEGSTNPAATVRCFEAQIREHNDWNRGINACKGQASAAAAPAAAGANGRNVSGVDFGSGGQKLGRFQQAGAQRWIEFNAAGQVAFRFEETGRDDWSVYLADRSRGVNLQLDLHTKKVMYSDANTPRRVQYDVLAASAAPVQAPPPVAQAPAPAPYQPPPPAPAPAPQTTAPAPVYTPPPVQYTAPPPPYNPPPPAAAAPAGASVRFGQGGRPMGEYREVAPGRWVEADTAGNVAFRFEEAGRDDRGIYLFDRSRGVHIELGLQSRKVMYGDPQSPRRALYDLLDNQPAAPAQVDGRNALAVGFGQGGQRQGEFRKISPQQWAEFNAGGQIVFRFDELRRDDWSVYLLDRSRGVNLQLDLHTRKVMYSDSNSARRPLYDVLDAR